MKIEEIDLFYLAMPKILDIGDGSQDALVVRVRSGRWTGWGESEASPLVSLANWICPMSHSACKGVRDAVAGATIHKPEDIVALGNRVRELGLDVAQTDHTWSGIEIALWDLLGQQRGEPVYRLLGYRQAYAKVPYASQLFGATPQETLEKARASREAGFQAVKFGWGNYGRGSVADDQDQVAAAREGLGPDGILLVDAGTVWWDDVAAAAERLPALEQFGATWFEEPFVGKAVHAYAQLADHCRTVRLAGGEGASNFFAARHLIDHGRIGYVQIDTGRIGGIAPAKQVADYATAHGVQFVNHTFTTHLALSASLAPFAGIPSARICEYPVEASELAQQLTRDHLPVVNGEVCPSERPGLGVEVNLDTVRKFVVDTEIKVNGTILYRTPAI